LLGEVCFVCVCVMLEVEFSIGLMCFVEWRRWLASFAEFNYANHSNQYKSLLKNKTYGSDIWRLQMIWGGNGRISGRSFFQRMILSKK